MLDNRFIQFELWKACRNGCRFCFNRHQPDLDKLESLDLVLRVLHSAEMLEYNKIGFIGGEFFDNQLYDSDVLAKFYEVFEVSKTLIDSGQINQIYITTSLLYDPYTYLLPFLSHLQTQGILDKVLLCTSFDLKYRFHTEKRMQHWKDTVQLLKETFPALRIHVETILSQFFIDAVLAGDFSIADFKRDYSANVDYIEPASGFSYRNMTECAEELPDFFPTRKSFIEFLYKTVVSDGDICPDDLFNLSLRSDTLYYSVNGERLVVKDRQNGNIDYGSAMKDIDYDIGFIDSTDKMRTVVVNFLKMWSKYDT